MEKTKKDFQISEYERNYWRKIHALNRNIVPTPKPGPTPIGQYILHFVELVNLEEEKCH